MKNYTREQLDGLSQLKNLNSAQKQAVFMHRIHSQRLPCPHCGAKVSMYECCATDEWVGSCISCGLPIAMEIALFGGELFWSAK